MVQQPTIPAGAIQVSALRSLSGFRPDPFDRLQSGRVGGERIAKTMNGFKGQPEETLPDHAWVAFRTKCGHAVGTAVIAVDYAAGGAAAVKTWERRGFVVEIRSVEWVRKHLDLCDCK